MFQKKKRERRTTTGIQVKKERTERQWLRPKILKGTRQEERKKKKKKQVNEKGGTFASKDPSLLFSCALLIFTHALVWTERKRERRKEGLSRLTNTSSLPLFPDEFAEVHKHMAECCEEVLHFLCISLAFWWLERQ